ncbi:MAG: hypothetical protein KDA96_12645 [Planctomycetaceae bacterium]|nr:hypothetical protein [Planctomycetaceae bacterium]
MNYLAHGYRFLDTPLFAAGTAVPDWLSVADRSVRVRSRRIDAVYAQLTQESRELAAGIRQHLADDDRFHRSETFLMLESELGVLFRRRMPDPFDHRPGFLGHIVTELMLDAILAERDPNLLPRYYAAIQEVCPRSVQETVNQIAPRTTDRLSGFIEAFLQTQFLYDYLQDGLLLTRLNQVLRRVKLPVMEDDCLTVLSHARQLLRKHGDALLQSVETGISPSERELDP